MYRAHAHDEFAGDWARGWAPEQAPAPMRAAPDGVPVPSLPDAIPPATFALRLRALRERLETRLHKLDLHTDLAEDIGSARWFRGFGTMLCLGVVALSFWPDFTTVEAATAMPVDDRVRDEFRSRMIMPLALGGESGHRMGPGASVIALSDAPERPSIRLVATLGQGDSFGRMLQRAGVGAGEAEQIAAMVASAVGPGEIRAGTQFDLTLGRRKAPGEPRPVDKLDFRARFDLALAVARREDGLAIERRPIPVDATPLRITGRVGPSLYRSARAAGAPLKAIQQYLQAIDTHASLESDVSPDDRFDMIVSYKRSALGETETGELLFAGLERAGKQRLQLLRWGREGQFYEASGMGQTAVSRQYAPVAGRITSRFGLRRHPILGYARMHAGIDFGAGHGSPIHAVSDGVVTFAGRHGGHGNYVRLNHGSGLGSGYGHMSRIAVASGTPVRAGQVIGYVGSTGLSTGPHLHFEVYRGGRPIDPLSVSFTARTEVNQEQLAAFKARLAALKQIRPGAALGLIARTRVAERRPAREIARLDL